MALADRLAAKPVTQHEPCPLGRLLTDLVGDELAALKTMLGTPDKWGWTAPDIYEALKGEGHTVGFKLINKHRGGNCRCVQSNVGNLAGL